MTDAIILEDVRKRSVAMMKLTGRILENVIRPLSQAQATTWREEPDGWTIAEVLGHIREFDGYFQLRARMMLDEELPTLPAYDHEALAVSHAYNEQDVHQALNELLESRERFVTFFKALTSEEWTRAGVHPERDRFTMTDAVMQVSMHDAAHLEQITRIISTQNV